MMEKMAGILIIVASAAILRRSVFVSSASGAIFTCISTNVATVKTLVILGDRFCRIQPVGSSSKSLNNEACAGDPEYDYSRQESWPGSCTTGIIQRPINIQPRKTVLDAALVNLKADYKANRLPTFIRSGDGLEVRRGDVPCGTLRIGNVMYNLTAFHFHSPSEHTISGER